MTQALVSLRLGRAEGVARRTSLPGRLERAATSLAEHIRGEVRFDPGSRALYATDGSNYRRVPLGVVIPRDAGDVIRTIETCRDLGLPILSRGGGTSLAGQCCNEAVVLDYSKYYHRVIELDVDKRLARLEPGTYLDVLRHQAEAHGLTFGPDPATHSHCTLGGMIGNNSCGVHALMSEFYGPGPRTQDHVESLDILTYRGVRMRVGATSPEELGDIVRAGDERARIYRQLHDLVDQYGDEIRSGFPDIPRRVSGYNLPSLLPENGFNVAQALVGSEGTCVSILEATVRLVPHRRERVLLVLGYEDVYHAADHIPLIREHRPVGCEGIDHKLIEYMRRKHMHASEIESLPEGNGWLLVEFGADTIEEAREAALAFKRRLQTERDAPHILEYGGEEAGHLWAVRESGLGATAYVPGSPDAWPGWEDAAVPPERVGAYLRDFRALLDAFGYDASLYGHFAQGCIHCRISFDLTSKRGVARYAAFTERAADLVVAYGGSLSGEHGDGQARGDLLPRMYSPRIMDAFRAFKRIWDPDGRMNPGKLIDARPRTDDLRLGAQYDPWEPDTHFKYAEDRGSFAHAALRCVGVGNCRRDEGGVMCPSYMATREEKHSTRGRAHLLFEMVHGGPISEGWSTEPVKESLELCLACKGCTSECPVSVDIPTYKAEFFSHYYETHRRPRSHYAFGLIDRWARLGSLAPRLVNFLARTPGLERIAKWVAGMSQPRKVPAFARHTFTKWFNQRPRGTVQTGRRVVLWPDTFNEHFMPQTLAAAVEVLERAGCEVVLPRGRLCCGRPLYDFGMLDRAKKLWEEILDSLEPHIRAGTPIVGLEPSCVAAFRDELPKLMGDQGLAGDLSKQVLTLAEYLCEIDYDPPHIEGKAIVQPHCHHQAVLDFDKESELLGRMGLDASMPNDTCCGMAGSFGFERDKYEVSRDVGERRLLPAVREAGEDVYVIADGFSCREQIQQGSSRQGLHLAEVLQLAWKQGEIRDKGELEVHRDLPERRLRKAQPSKLVASGASATLGAFVVLVPLVLLPLLLVWAALMAF